MIPKTKLEACNKDCNPIIQFDSDKTKPYFFKLILNPLDQNHHLRIPMEFVKKYRKYLSDDISLNVQNSEQPWKVRLEKDRNNMFLGKGWQTFMEFYGMKYGNFLLFRFDGGSHLESQFHVLMFDNTAVEMDYPVRVNSPDVEMMQATMTDDEKDIDVSKEMLVQIYSPNLNKTIETIKIESSDDNDNDNDTNGDDDDDNDNDDKKYSHYKGKGRINSHYLNNEIPRKLDEFDSPHPHFKTIMHPSHVDHRGKRGVPFKHATKYFTSETKEITLRGPNGKAHRVRYYLGKKTSELLYGWRNFVLDNQLHIGDACVFELIDPPSHSYEVTIFRHTSAC